MLLRKYIIIMRRVHLGLLTMKVMLIGLTVIMNHLEREDLFPRVFNHSIVVLRILELPLLRMKELL
jgi:hypothetical protein